MMNHTGFRLGKLGRFGVATAATLAACVALVPACTDSSGEIFVYGVQAPTERGSNGLCTFTADTSGLFLSGGVLDTAFTRTYVPRFLVGSQMVSRAQSSSLQVDSAKLMLEGGVVRIFDSSGAEIRAFTQLSSGLVNPGSGTTPSYLSFTILIIDSQTATKIHEQLLPAGPGSGQVKRLNVSVKFFGTTLGGTRVESSEFQFPVSVCYGCLVSFPPESLDKSLQLAEGGKPNCAAAGDSISAPCVPGQDQAVDCRLCQGNAACDPANLLQ